MCGRRTIFLLPTARNRGQFATSRQECWLVIKIICVRKRNIPLIFARDLLHDILYQKPAFLTDRHYAARHNTRTKQSRLRHNLANVNLRTHSADFYRGLCSELYVIDQRHIGRTVLLTYIHICNSMLLVVDTLRHATLLPSVLHMAQHQQHAVGNKNSYYLTYNFFCSGFIY